MTELAVENNLPTEGVLTVCYNFSAKTMGKFFVVKLPKSEGGQVNYMGCFGIDCNSLAEHLAQGERAMAVPFTMDTEEDLTGLFTLQMFVDGKPVSQLAEPDFLLALLPMFPNLGTKPTANPANPMAEKST